MTIRAVLQEVPLFKGLDDQALDWLAAQATELRLQPGEFLFTAADHAREFGVLVAGEIQITKQVGGMEMGLDRLEVGGFIGEIALLTGTRQYVDARAVGETRLLCFSPEAFHDILNRYSSVSHTILRTMARRIRNAEVLMQQRERMVALGTLAAGLAHEINNPASAAHSSVRRLRSCFETLASLALKLGALQLTADQLGELAQLQSDAMDRSAAPPTLDPLARSDREEEVGAWLEAHGIADGWYLASTFVQAGLDLPWLEDLAKRVPPYALDDVVNWLEAHLAALDLVGTVEQGTSRISELVKAVKSYSYMDQAPLQEIDVHEGLDSTLAILAPRITDGVVVQREYDRSLPRVCAYAGELNQVWTNLIDNALDAIAGTGRIWVRTTGEDGLVVVEIADDGPGIPPAIQSRVFDPFFTTKEVGAGSGLGLDISRRIVVGRHHGDISVTSTPGDTRFRVRLPLTQPGT